MGLAGGCARAAGVAVLAAVASLALAPAAAAADQPFVHVETAAAAVLVSSTQHPGLTPFSSEVVDDAQAYAASALESGAGSEAQAAVLYPGALVVHGPALLCSDIVPSYFGTDCPVQPPDYPLLADATYPTQPHDVAAQAEASAQEASNSAVTRTADVHLLAGTPARIDIGSAVSTTIAKIHAGRVQVHVESLLHDVTIAGQVHVASISTVDDITAAPQKPPVDRPKVTLAGVTVAGQPASIDDSGVHVPGHDGPALPGIPEGQGLTVRLVGTDRVDHPGSARSTATGLQVTATVPISGIPSVPNPAGCPPDPFPCPPNPSNLNATYLVTLTLGSVGAVVAAQPGLAFDLGGVLLPTGGVGGSGAAPMVAGHFAAPALSGTAGVTGTAAAPQLASSGGPGTPAGLSRLSLDALYTVLALVTASLFVGWRAVTTLATGRRRR